MNRYIINVAQTGRHYCRIELPETFPVDAIAKATEIKRLFGAAFEVTMTCWNDVGTQVKLEALT